MKKIRFEKSVGLLTLIFTLAFISGVSLGAVAARFLGQQVNISPSGARWLPRFTKSFISFIKPCIIILLSGFTRFSPYFSSSVIFYRGGIMGFVIGTLIKNHGILAAISATLPQNIIFYPLLLIISLVSANARKMPSVQVLILLLTVAVCALSATLDTFATDPLIRHFIQ